VKLLLDTHTLIWFFNGDSHLSEKAKYEILHPENQKFVSIASIWEVAIKIGLGKLIFKQSTKGFIQLIEDNGFEIFPIATDSVIELEKLPYLHRDPFDRIIVATALTENMYIVSADKNIQLYQINCIW
jgi:PIN domain nuclease of toxin-antitoxin system